MRRFVLLLALLAAPAAAQTGASRHMVAAAHPLAAEAGLAALRAGGSAVDAAVAVQMVLTLVEPQSSGIGGGALMLHFDAARRETTAWDGRETAPAAATPALFLRPDGQPLAFYDAVLSGRSVGVPGAVAMLEAAHRAQGRLPWASLIEPAIRLAEQGFAVSPRLAQSIAADAERLRRDPGARAYFFDAAGAPLAAGTMLRNPALAETLRAIAADGAAALQRGPIAEAMLAAIAAHGGGGPMAAADLAAYRPAQRAPVCAPYRVFIVCGFPPPSSGGVAVAQILGLLEHFDIASLAPDSADFAHLFVEAVRLAFADRNLYLADSDFVRQPIAGLIEGAYLTQRAQLLDRDRAAERVRAGHPRWREAALAPQETQPENGTSHIAIVDAAGNAVSVTTTVEDAFGARLFVRGFLLNNQLTDFSFRPEAEGRPVANRVEPGKRPRSSMSPTLVFTADGALHAVVGSPGGARIISYVAQTLVAMLDWGMPPQEAINLPRIASLGTIAELEANTPGAALAAALTARGHRTEARALPSGVQAILRREGRLVGGADPRREGVALGD
jgi:gamma-glutamyltranspeptidase / glutathione hydrolase